MSDKRFYIYDMNEKVVVTNLDLDDTKLIFRKLYLKGNSSFNVFRHMPSFPSIVRLHDEYVVTADFTIDENGFVDYRGE